MGWDKKIGQGNAASWRRVSSNPLASASRASTTASASTPTSEANQSPGSAKTVSRPIHSGRGCGPGCARPEPNQLVRLGSCNISPQLPGEFHRYQKLQISSPRTQREAISDATNMKPAVDIDTLAGTEWETLRNDGDHGFGDILRIAPAPDRHQACGN